MGVHKYKIDYGNTDIFKYYKEKTGNPHKLTQKKYFDIFEEFITYVKELMLNNGFSYHMPARLGNLHFYKYKVKIRLNPDGSLDKRNLRVDWDATKKFWAELYPGKTIQELKEIKDKPRLFYMNKHTDGFRIRLKWDKTTAYYKYKSYYRLKLVRQFARQVAEVVKSNPNVDFMQFDPTGIDYKTIRRLYNVQQ